MNRCSRVIVILVLLALGAGPAMADEDEDRDKPKGYFWESEDFQHGIMSGTGSGGGPSMTWYRQDLDAINEILRTWDPALEGIPEKDLYWGGAGWGGIATGNRFFVGIGGGGLAGSQESRQGDRYSKWSHAAGYFAVKGIWPAHRRLFLEGGIQLGGGNSSLWVEREDDSGLIEIHLRGDRAFLLLRPHLGVDLRLARWIGILVEGGYAITNGAWSLEGAQALISKVNDALPDGNGPYLSVLIRFGI